jgi:hypothetical protein
MALTLEEKMLKRAGKELADEIDWGILSALLIESGWTKLIRKPFASKEEAVDISDWIENSRIGQVRSLGTVWLFEKEQDAIMFSLRWL